MVKRYVSWTDYLNALEITLQDVLKDGADKFTFVAGISRGGLIPATLFSHRLVLPLISIDPNFSFKSPRRGRGLLVDDISDSGNTFSRVIKENADWVNWKVAAPYYKSSTVTLPHYSSTLVSPEEWVVFPYESDFDQPLLSFTERRNGSLLSQS